MRVQIVYCMINRVVVFWTLLLILWNACTTIWNFELEQENKSITGNYNIINENILKIFIHEITDVNKIINCIWRVKFISMGISSQEAVQQSIINIRLLNTKCYPQNILLDKITSEMINSLTNSGV